MSNQWVVNASPLILLANAGYEALFAQLADEVRVPQAVAREVRVGPKQDRARQLIARRYWQTIATPAPSSMLLAWDLGAGETAVIAYALANPGWTAILDDGAARRCAKACGVPIKGTLGVVLLAKQRGIILSARVLLEQMQARGFRIDNQVLAAALALVGEAD
jgi:predicted nucleic acid-binding protein